MINFINNLKKINKCVSTIPDECKGVDLEMSTKSKRKATNYLWNI